MSKNKDTANGKIPKDSDSQGESAENSSDDTEPVRPKTSAGSWNIDFKNHLTMDEIVRQSLINDNWKIIESRKSRLVSTLPRYPIKHLVSPSSSLEGISQRLVSAATDASRRRRTQEVEHSNDVLDSRVSWNEYNFGRNQDYENQRMMHSKNLTRNRASEEKFSKDRSRHSRRNQSILATEGRELRDRNSSLNGDFNIEREDNVGSEEVFLNYTLKKKRHGVPLPEFGSLDGENGGYPRTSEAPHLSQWSMRDKGSLPFYDNLVGLGLKKPLLMLVPQSVDDDAPRVGELNIDQLSELSEISTYSNVTPDTKSDFDNTNASNHFYQRSDSYTQTENPSLALHPRETSAWNSADIIAKIRAERAGINMRGRSLSLTKSTEGDEVDPKFIERPPADVEVVEGEALSVTCTLTGTLPIDVFWFRDELEVTQLEESHRCDVVHVGNRFRLDLFDVEKKDGGHYLCIGVNSLGHCVQRFRLRVRDSNRSKTSPSFSMNLQDLEVSESSKAVLWCKVAGYPPPRVLWFCENERLKDGKNFTIEPDYGGIHRLTIQDVGQKTREYKAVARNSVREVSATVQVIIKPKEAQNVSLSNRRANSSSPYPDVEELVEIAQKAASQTPKEAATTSKLLSRFSAQQQVDQAANQISASSDRPISRKTVTWNETVLKSFESTENNEDYNDAAPPHTKLSDSSSDDEDMAELNISYKDFERLFESKLVSRSQLVARRVYTKDLEKIKAFLNQNSEAEIDSSLVNAVSHIDDVPLHIHCGLKKINADFYKRDYVVNDSSSRSGRAGGFARLEAVAGKMQQTYATHFQDNKVQVMSHETEIGKKDERLALQGQNSDEEDGLNEEFPCVKELVSKFDVAPLSPDEPEEPISPLKRIYSLTGRSVPEFVQERIQRQFSKDEILQYREDACLPPKHENPAADGSKEVNHNVKNTPGIAKKRSNTVVLQRATYWQNRLSRRQTTDVFPEMVNTSHKRVET